MTMNDIWRKLRKNNKGQYRQFRFCVGFAVMLITSYLMMLQSPLIQNTLPEGGDSRKQVYMIFVLAAVGCVIFIAYAAGLFLRYKSREVGVFLALGTNKKKVRKALLYEIAACAAATSAAGFAAGCLLAWCIGRLFELLVKGISEYRFGFTLAGFGASLIYAAVVFALVIGLAIRFMKRGNIMDILNEQRKQEPLKKIVTPKYLISGWVLLAAGILLGFLMPTAVAKMTGHYLGAWTNLFYLAALLGLYQILVYSVSCHRRGVRPQRYYNHLISYGMLKFQGRSIVRNMLVISLLLAGGLFAVFYIPQNTMTMQEGFEKCEAMYSMFYTKGAKVPDREEIYNLAKQHGVKLRDYRKAQFVQAVGSGVKRDDVDENNNLMDVYEEKHAVYEFLSVSGFEILTGQSVQVEEGAYYQIQTGDAQENLFFRFDDLDQVYLDKKDVFMKMEYKGNLVYHSLVQGYGFDAESRYVISDADYDKLKAGTSQFPRETQVLFDSDTGSEEDETEKAEAFSAALYKEFGERMAEDMKVCGAFDAYQSFLAGPGYGYAGMVRYDPKNSTKEADWQYEPQFLPLRKANGVKSYSVYMLLFLYVAVICLAAAGIISFARSQSVGLSSQQVFQDLERLGADRQYLNKLLAKQVRKVYVLPTAIGTIGIFAFEALLLQGNDGRLTADELKLLPIIVLVLLVTAAYQYSVYRFSMKKVAEMLRIANESGSQASS
ncbi:MAG: FtsX-like permease family protein [Firmicutes bacterium]|nr:FtsX-like permease family protein [Bacillota bacterium]